MTINKNREFSKSSKFTTECGEEQTSGTWARKHLFASPGSPLIAAVDHVSTVIVNFRLVGFWIFRFKSSAITREITVTMQYS